MENLSFNVRDCQDLLTRILLHIPATDLAQMALLSPRPSAASRACMAALREVDAEYAAALEADYPLDNGITYDPVTANQAAGRTWLTLSKSDQDSIAANMPKVNDETSAGMSELNENTTPASIEHPNARNIQVSDPK